MLELIGKNRGNNEKIEFIHILQENVEFDQLVKYLEQNKSNKRQM